MEPGRNILIRCDEEFWEIPAFHFLTTTPLWNDRWQVKEVGIPCFYRQDLSNKHRPE